ncbi:hypothetical protein T492DRAFT_889242, partial [Pavlovales sp. CCMP2436]
MALALSRLKDAPNHTQIRQRQAMSDATTAYLALEEDFSEEQAPAASRARNPRASPRQPSRRSRRSRLSGADLSQEQPPHDGTLGIFANDEAWWGEKPATDVGLTALVALATHRDLAQPPLVRFKAVLAARRKLVSRPAKISRYTLQGGANANAVAISRDGAVIAVCGGSVE